MRRGEHEFRRRGSNPYARALRGGQRAGAPHPCLRVVQLGSRQPERGSVKILSGIQEGERVAVTNLADLYDGAPVSIAAATRQEP